MRVADHHIWLFGDLSLDTDRAELTRAGNKIALRAQSYRVLLYFLQNAGRLVSKKELLDNIWEGKAVTDDSITHCVIDIRKALGDNDHELLKTIPRQGYMFDCEVGGPDHTEASVLSFRSAGLYGGLAVLLIVLSISELRGWPGAAENPPSTDVPSRISLSADMADTRMRQSPGYAAFVQAEHVYDRRGVGDLEQALRLYEQATVLDPSLARAWAGVAAVYRIRIAKREVERTTVIPIYFSAIERAHNLDPRDTEIRLRYAQALYLKGDKEKAGAILQAALQRDPDNPLALGIQAGMAGASGDLQRAVRLQRRVTEVDPLSSTAHNNLSHMLAAAGDFDGAIESNRRALMLSPSRFAEHDAELAHLLILQGRYEEALQIIEQCPVGLDRHQGLALVYQALGNDEQATRALQLLTEQGHPEAMVRLAEYYAHTGDSERAFDLLDELYVEWTENEHSIIESSGAVTRIRYSPYMQSIRGDERWMQWLRRVST